MSKKIVQSIFAGITLMVSAVYNSAFAAPSVRQLGVGSTSGVTATKATTTGTNASRSATKTTPAVKKIISATPAKTATARTTATTSTSDPIRLVGLPVSSGNNGVGNTTLGTKTGSVSTVVYNTKQRVDMLEDALATAATKEDMNTLRLEAGQAILNATEGLQDEQQVVNKINEMTADLQTAADVNEIVDSKTANFQTAKQVNNRIQAATQGMVTTNTLNSELENSAKIQGMETAISGKVDSNYVDNAIDSATDGMIKDTNLDAALANSTKISSMETAISGKVDSSYVTEATKDMITKTTLDSELANSEKISAMDSAIAGKTSLDDVNAAINNSEKFGDYYTKTQIDTDFVKDNALSGKLDTYVANKDFATKTDVRDGVNGLAFRVSGETLQSSIDSVAWKDVAPISTFGGTPGCSPDIVSDDAAHTITISGCGKPDQVVSVASSAEDTTCKNNEVVDVKLDPTNNKKILVSRCNSSSDEEISLPDGGECDNYLTDISLSSDKKSITAKKCGTPITPIQICETTSVIDYDEDQGCTRKATKDCNGTLTFVGECLSSGGDICPSSTSPEFASAIKSIARNTNSITVSKCNNTTEEIPVDNCPVSKMVKYQKPGESSACWRKMTTKCDGTVTYDDCETLGGNICPSASSAEFATAIKNIERGTNGGLVLTRCNESTEQVDIPQQCELQITASRFQNKMVQDVQKSGTTLTGKCNGAAENLFSEDVYDAEATVDETVVLNAVTTKLNALGLSSEQITALTNKTQHLDETNGKISKDYVDGLGSLAGKSKVSLSTDVDDDLLPVAKVDGLTVALEKRPMLDNSSNKLSTDVIPDLSESYAKLTSGKISSDVVPALNYQAKGNYATLDSNNKLSTDVIPTIAQSKVDGLETALAGKQSTISDLSTIRSNATNGSTAYGYFSGGVLKTAAVPTIAQSKVDGLETALAGKQSTISDLSTIRSNATNGSTAYGYFSGGVLKTAAVPTIAQSKVDGLETALAGKQSTISDLDTIRAGATNGTTVSGYFTKTGVLQTSSVPNLSDTYATSTRVTELESTVNGSCRESVCTESLDSKINALAARVAALESAAAKN